MKYAILLGDGMADLPHEAFGGRTVLEAARTPAMDLLAARGELGLVNTVTAGLPPGSDVTNLAILGVDPATHYTGRSPLEAASIGVALGPDDTCLRCNLVSLSSGPEGDAMDDYSAGHIATNDARPLIEALDRHFRERGLRFFPGKSYRHLAVMAGLDPSIKTTPPHDIAGKPIAPYLPKGEGADFLREVMEASRALFREHPVNRALAVPATQAWFWGLGRAPKLPAFRESTGLSGAMVSAVDLLRGIATYMGMEVINVPGATGYLDTNYEGKVEAAKRFLASGGDFVFVHLEAPDECGHNGVPEDKRRAIEDFDARVVGPMVDYLEEQGAYRVLVMPDHATPLAHRTHTTDPVPFILASNDDVAAVRSGGYSERAGKATGVTYPNAMQLFARLVGNSPGA
ncbi:cofactor-independent phosphoglycerate mutase [bacterium]|nr:cofactor-independent phosphoglycerate mutase [bacterium]